MHRHLQESLSVLTLLRLIDPEKRSTPLKIKAQSIPLEPRLALMLEKAQQYHCFEAICIIVSFFMGQEPRLQPRDQRELSQNRQRCFRDLRSDFITLLNLYSGFSALKNKALKDVSVWGGKKDLISLGAENDIKLTLPRTTFRNNN